MHRKPLVTLALVISLSLPAAAAQGDDQRSDLLGPFLDFVSSETLLITWETDQPETSIVEFGPTKGSLETTSQDALTTRHEVLLSRVPRDKLFDLRVGGRRAGEETARFSPVYQFDSTLNYVKFLPPAARDPFERDESTLRYQSLASRIVETLPGDRGYGLVLGAGDGRLAYHLAQLTQLQLIVVEEEADRVQRVREVLDEAGLYGGRVTVHHGPLDALPYGPYFANLIVAEGALHDGRLPADLSSLYQLLRPAGGVMYVGAWQQDGASPLSRDALAAWQGKVDLAHGESWYVEEDGLFWVHRRGVLPGAGEWSHQYAAADNASCSRDELVRGDLTVLWWGRPGPRPMPDRGPRNPAPVSAGGRLFIQGNRTLFGLDAYNGTILWFKQIPTMRRANMPRDGSNMVATDDYLYLALDDQCVGFDARTGHRVFGIDLPHGPDDVPYDWGYLARVDNLLLGSATKRGSHYLGDKGEWYEEFRGTEVARVTSDSLFAVDRHRGAVQWTYRNGVIINSTIAVADGRVYFIESRSPAARNATTNRLFEEVQTDQHLVALDLASGEVYWEEPYDFSRCQYMTYLVVSGGTLVVTGSDEEKIYHTYAFDAPSGRPLWQHETASRKRHHSGQLDHPTIVGDRLYLNKHTFALRTGEVLEVTDFDWHGCGVTSASRHSLFRRYEYHGMQDLATGERTEFLGIRGGCWLNLIPSGGVVLAPEASAGCSCGHAIQSSIAYVPRKLPDWKRPGDSQP